MKKIVPYGGDWTAQKLAALQSYLQAYLKVFKNQRNWVELYYIDAFAGPGLWQSQPKEKKKENLSLSFIEDVEEDAELEKYKRGSPMIALDMPEPGFNRFVFVEQNEEYLTNLKNQVENRHPEKIGSVEFVSDDANDAVDRLCRNWNREKWRAVVFLDPFGMEVKWQTIEAIARTKSMDLWVLFPLGVAVNRMLTTDGKKIHPAWKEKLDTLFGTQDWHEYFYRRDHNNQASLPCMEEDEDALIRDVSFEKIAAYFIERLKSVFPAAGVVKEPLMLRNSKNNPLFALCFAVGNPKGAKIAINIATHIIGGKR